MAAGAAEASGVRTVPAEAERPRAFGWLTAEFLAEHYQRQGHSADKIAA